MYLLSVTVPTSAISYARQKQRKGQEFNNSVETFYDQRRSIDNDAPSINGQHKLTETALLVSDGSKTKTSLWKIKQTLDEKKIMLVWCQRYNTSHDSDIYYWLFGKSLSLSLSLSAV